MTPLEGLTLSEDQYREKETLLERVWRFITSATQ